MAAKSSKKRARKTPGANFSAARMRSPRRKPTELDLRRTPMQARGQATFERILDATGHLLDKVGTDALTTNLIAKAADVNVATLYQYFPNKQSVLLSLFQRQNDALIQLVGELIQDFTQAPDWRKALQNVVRAVARSRAEQPGVVALRQAMRSSPDLLAHDQVHTVQVADVLAKELMAVGTKADQAKLVSRCSLEALSAVLDMWSIGSGGKDDRLVEEAAQLMIRYLAPHIDGATGAKPLRPRR